MTSMATRRFTDSDDDRGEHCQIDLGHLGAPIARGESAKVGVIETRDNYFEYAGVA